MRSEEFEGPSGSERLLEASGSHEERQSCLACGGDILSGEATIRIHGAPVHMRCAIYRRQLTRR
jgi:hypothetical protein